MQKLVFLCKSLLNIFQIRFQSKKSRRDNNDTLIWYVHTSCLRSSSESPAQRYLCCSNSYRVVLVTTATFEGLKPLSACKAPLHTLVWWKYRRPLPLVIATTGFRQQRNVLKAWSVILVTKSSQPQVSSKSFRKDTKSCRGPDETLVKKRRKKICLGEQRC